MSRTAMVVLFVVLQAAAACGRKTDIRGTVAGKEIHLDYAWFSLGYAMAPADYDGQPEHIERVSLSINNYSPKEVCNTCPESLVNQYPERNFAYFPVSWWVTGDQLERYELEEEPTGPHVYYRHRLKLKRDSCSSESIEHATRLYLRVDHVSWTEAGLPEEIAGHLVARFGENGELSGSFSARHCARYDTGPRIAALWRRPTGSGAD